MSRVGKSASETGRVHKSEVAAATTRSEDAPTLDEVAGEGGRQQAAASYERARGADPQDAIRRIEDWLSGWVSDGDARDALSTLEDLSPADRKLVWETMGAGSQATLLDNLDGSGRGLLLETLADAGVVERARPATQPAQAAKGTVAGRPWGDPPPGPALFERDPAQPKGLREAIHEQNVERASRYREAYGDYLHEYKEQVVLPAAAKKDIASVRRAGPPAPMLLPEREPGAPLGAPGRDEVNRADAWRKATDVTGALVDVYGPITRAIHHARGELVAGELRFGVEAEAKVLGYGGSASVDVGVDGDVNTGDKLSGGPVSYSDGGGGQIGAELGGAVGGGGAVRVDDKGNLQVSEVSGTLGVVGLGADLEKGTAKVDVGYEAKLGNVATAKLKATAEFDPFVTRQEVADGLHQREGFFETPRELKEGKAWKDLPDERRAELERRLSWSEREWTGERRRSADLVVHRPIG